MADVTASELKVALKKWENDFKAEYGRKPNKDDISQAGDDVQDKYKRYYSLTRTLQTVDVWGAELNKNVRAERKGTAEQTVRKTSSFSLGQKLWNNSKLLASSKPRVKSCAFKQMSPSVTRDENTGVLNAPKLSQGGLWEKEDTPRPQRPKPICVTPSDPLPPPLNFASPIRKTASSPMEEFMFQPKKGSMFEKAIRVSHSAKKCATPAIDPADVYEPLVKKSPLTSFKIIDLNFLDQVEENFETIEKPSSSPCHDVTTASPLSKPSFRKETSFGDDTGSSQSESNVHSDNHSMTSKMLNKTTLAETNSLTPPQVTNDLERTESSSRRSCKRKASASPPAVQPVEPQTQDNGDDFRDDPFIELPGTLQPPHVSKKQRSVSHGVSIIKDGNVVIAQTPASAPAAAPAAENSTEESCPLKASSDKDMDEISSDDDEKKPAAKKSKLKKMGPAKSTAGGGGGGSLSTNYVRLNMKVKSYRRRGGGRTGGQMKRLQWKQKMASRAISRGGSGAGGCFKCGQDGHWAKNCKGKKPSSEPVEDDSGPPQVENLPSLSDALRMAHGKPKRQPKLKKVGTAETAESKDDGSDTAADTIGMQEEVDYLEELEFVRQCMAEKDDVATCPPPTKPLYDLTDTGDVPATPTAVYKALSVFGYKTFRPGQETAVMRILCGQTTLVQLATGAGKSLCYQLPALMYARRSSCLTLCISPLISLMEDQVANLPPGLKGACLHTNMTKSAREKIAEELTTGDIHFLLLSPEALISTGRLLDFSKLPPIAFACIDEAHCVSSWSHNFRPSYLRVCKVLRERLGVQCLLGLTATATQATAMNVAEHIGTRDGEKAFIRGAAIPDNLVLSTSRDGDRDRALLQLLQGERFSACHSIIIYCTRRQTTERLSAMIRTNLKDIKHTTKINKSAPQSKSKKAIQVCEEYHAGLPAHSRKRVQLLFMNGTLRIVVATVAFGMGLDKQDVHGIIHYNLPGNFESYVQEIGRAGRDGNTSHCHVFLDERGSDVDELKRHIFADTVDRITVKKFIKRFFLRCRCQELEDRFAEIEEDGQNTNNAAPNVCPGHERAVVIDKLVHELDLKEEGISTLLCYLELDESCMVEILNLIYATCVLTSHSGRPAFTDAAKKCPALAVALAQVKERGEHFDGRSVTFPVVDVADRLGTTSGVVKREISGLKWTQTMLGGYQRSPFLIEYSDLAFHIRCRGNLSDDEVDGLVDLLHSRIVAQEVNALEHLHYFYNVMHSVAHKDHYMCADEADLDRSDRLKGRIRKYFAIDGVNLPSDDTIVNKIEQPDVNEDGVCADVQQFVYMYSEEHSLSARCIARIFHGIASPNFPSEVWGRVRRYWRCHLDVEFNHLLRLIKRTLIRTK